MFTLSVLLLIPLIVAGIGALASVASSAIAANAAKKNLKAASDVRSQGEALAQKTLAERKDYTVAPEVQQLYGRAESELNAKSGIQTALETQADTGVSNVLSSVSRNATSSAGAIAAAQAAEAQRQAGYQNAAVAGATQRSQKLDRLTQATDLLAGKKDTAFDLNHQQVFEMEYNRAADMVGAGFNGQTQARTQRANAWTEGISAVNKIAQNTDWSSLKKPS